MPGTLPPQRPPSSIGEARTLPQAKLADDGAIELTSAAFLDELGPPSPVSREKAASLVGTLISGRYRADEILGQGGMGAVYLGEQIHLRKRVAIKVLHPEVEKLAGLVDRFEREAVAGARVQHPNVAAAVDFGKLDDGSYFLVLEYVEGTPLSAVLDGVGRLAPARALRIARQIADALAAVHAKGIVHRDVKPQNTLLGRDDHVKIIDFGLAKVDIGSATGRKPAKREVPLTAAGVVFGTPAYLAPEAALGMGAVDARSDLYAVGVTLYEMLTGCLPFQEKDPALLFKQQRLEDPPSLRQRAPDVAVPAAAEVVAMRLVQRDPADRYQSAREAVAAIDEALRTLARPRAAVPPGAVAAVAAVALAIAVVAAVALRKPAVAPGAPSAAAPSVSVPLPSAPAPSASTPAPEAETLDLDVPEWRVRLDKANQIRDWVAGSRAFLALARLDPTLLDDAGMRARVIAVAAGIAHEGRSDLADAVFDTLSNRLGASGLDLLYELALSRGGTRGGQRARAILGHADVIAREPPALRVAFEFFVGSCATRRSLLDRAAAEGDRRTLVQLEAAHGARCSNKKDPCCFREDPAMADAIHRLKGRVKN